MLRDLQGFRTLRIRGSGADRNTQRHGGRIVGIEENKLRKSLREIDAEHIRGSGRKVNGLLRRVGWTINHERTQGLWREEGLQRPTHRKRKRARPSDGSVRHHRAEYQHQVWAMDFQFDATTDGRRLKFLNVIDERSRLCLAIRVGRSARPRTWWPCWRGSQASTEHRRTTAVTTDHSSLPRS